MRIAPVLEIHSKDPIPVLKKTYQQQATAFNGQVSFGNGVSKDNIDGTWISVVAPVAPNTDFVVNHNLNRLPVGYLVMQKDRACDVYTGSVAPTKTQLTLRATVASAVLKLFVLSLLLCLYATRSAAQGANHTNIALQTITASGSGGISGPLLKPISGAVITVCNGSTLPLAGTTCTGLASIFSNIALTTALSNPTNADTNGNYTFYVTAGQAYVISVGGVGLTTYSYVFTAPVVGVASGAATSLNNLAAVSINTSLLAQSGVDLGSPTNPFRNMYLVGSGTYGANYFGFAGTPTAPRTQTWQDVSDTFVYRSTTDIFQNKTLDASLNVFKWSSNTVGHFLRNNGTQYVDNTIQATDLPATTSNCTGTNFAQGLNAGGTPICASPTLAEASLTTGASALVTTATSTATDPQVFLANAHTLTRLIAIASTQASGCGTQPVVALYDQNTAATVSTLTIPNTTTLVDSGALSVAMTAGHRFSVSVTTIGAGCGTNALVKITATYQ